MRILLVTFGSLGDLHPMLALGQELERRGHEAIVGTSEYFRAKVTAFGLPFAPVRPDFRLDDEALVRRIMSGWRGTEFLLRELVYPSVGVMYPDLAALAERTDLMVSSEIACAAPILAAQRPLRWAYFALSPISFLSACDPSVLPGTPIGRLLPRLGPAANRFVFQLARLFSHRWWAPVRRLRRQLGLPAGESPLFAGKFSPQLNLALFSRELQPPQADWPANTVQAGFCFFDEEPAVAGANTQSPDLPAPVARFLAAGEPPVVFTLGSAAVHLARDFYEVSAQAARQLGRRALLLLGRNPPPRDLPPTSLAWDYLPYARIFPRAAAIVHQGGIGTTAQALRAGRPMLVVPFAHDQFDNAARIVRLGCGATIPRRRYHAAAVAEALRSLLVDPRCASCAAGISARLRNENGAARAADAIEALLRSPPRAAAHSA